MDDRVEDADQLSVQPDSKRLGIHYLFRYPAKFHAPVARALIDRFTNPDDLVFDPFCGSGSLLIEAAVRQRRSVGSDIDPVAVSVSRAKSMFVDPSSIEVAVGELDRILAPLAREDAEYERLKFSDIGQSEFEEVVSGEELWIPAIPNLHHWFRRYVSVDLARIHRKIVNLDTDERTRFFLRVVFSSIIRNSSNADPVPVSGLEVTAHMKRLDAAGRLVNPFALFRRAATKAVISVLEYSALARNGYEPIVRQADAANLSMEPESCDAVITSPPYHNAVDYYRRHQLEMFWLGHTLTQQDRIELLPGYIGRHRIPQKTPILSAGRELPPLAAQWESEIGQLSRQRALDFRHYALSMHAVFEQLAEVVKVGSPVVFVVGRSGWNGGQIPTDELFTELASANFIQEGLLSYPVKNRYMSYSRRNSASIDREYVLILRRKI